MNELEELLSDLYAYVDEQRSFLTGEDHDPPREWPYLLWPAESTPLEDNLKERIISALEKIRGKS